MIDRINVRLLTTQRSVLQFITLDGLRVGLQTQWSKYGACWYLWIHSNANALIAGPIKLVGGLDLLLPYKHDPRVPQGQLFVHGDVPTSTNIDVDALLLYRPLAQVIS